MQAKEEDSLNLPEEISLSGQSGNCETKYIQEIWQLQVVERCSSPVQCVTNPFQNRHTLSKCDKNALLIKVSEPTVGQFL